jgi:selenocysteine lyase/cysteine desulfurase
MAQEKMISLGHYFNPSSNLKHKLGLAGDNYELTQSIPAIVDYFGPDLDASFKKIEQHEEVLQRVLLAYLRGRSDVTIYGEVEASAKLRVSTIGFVIKGWASRDVVEIIDRETNFGCRWGTFYSVRLANDLLGLGDDGLVRVSMVHYNTCKSFHT